MRIRQSHKQRGRSHRREMSAANPALKFQTGQPCPRVSARSPVGQLVDNTRDRFVNSGSGKEGDQEALGLSTPPSPAPHYCRHTTGYPKNEPKMISIVETGE